MKLIHSAFVIIVATGALAAGPSTAQASPMQATKVTTKSAADRAEARLKADATLKKYDISVAVDNGVATLKGTVATEAQKMRAARDVRVTGVTKVDNQITVDKSVAATTKDTLDKAADKTKAGAEKAVDATKSGTEKAYDKTKDATKTAAEKTKDAAKTTGEKTKDAASTVGDKTKDAASKTGEVITDAWITTKVKADFVNEDTLKGSDINVDTNNHVVTLKGTVKSAAGRARALEIAKTTKGVNRVVDQLTVK